MSAQLQPMGHAGGGGGVTVTPPTPTVSAALSWTAPTENADGSPVNDLAGYRIYYGTNAADLTSKVDVSGAQSTTYVLKGLINARYFFAVVAFNSLGAPEDWIETAATCARS